MSGGRFRAALAGPPNCGKSTLFNALTGARQTVGNWPGVTVERKEGTFRHDGDRIDITDLPGLYSLTVMTGGGGLDEAVSRRHLLTGGVDVVVNILDATKLERTLYLTAQVLEMGLPMVVAVNLIDAARHQGARIDIDAMARTLGCPVVAVSAATGEGLEALKDAMVAVGRAGIRPTGHLPYDADTEAAVAGLTDHIAASAESQGVGARWLAAKLIEGDSYALAAVDAQARQRRAAAVAVLEAETGEEADSLLADARFGFAHTLAGRALIDRATRRRHLSDTIDRVALGRWTGLPLFLFVIYAMFTVTINLGGAFVDFFDMAAAALLVEGGRFLMTGAPDWLSVLVADGIGGGLRVVGTFIPIIGFLFLILAFLEDSGYMARAAFLLDRYMRVIGLPGKAFVPLVVGFGCNVPAVMATRTLDRHRDRVMTIAMTPFMSCGARLAVYTMFVAAFFPVGGQNVVFVLYLAGVGAAVATGLVLKHTFLRGPSAPLMIELPDYRLPRPRSLAINAWTRLKGFVVEAGRVIVTVVMLLTLLGSLGTDGTFGNEGSGKSVLSEAARGMSPAFSAIGIEADNWPAVVGLVTGVFAKEAVVGSLDSLYGNLAEAAAPATETPKAPFDLGAALAAAVATIPENLGKLNERLTDPFGIAAVEDEAGRTVAGGGKAGTIGAMAARFDGGLGAFAYLLFVLLYAPCAATLGAIHREIGGRWTGFIAAWSLGLAYLAAATVYQLGTLARHPAQSLVFLGVGWGAAILVVVAMRRAGTRGTAESLAAAE